MSDFGPLTSKVASWALPDKNKTMDQYTVGDITNNRIGEGPKPTRYRPSEEGKLTGHEIMHQKANSLY